MVHQNHNSALTGMLLVGTVICTTVGNWVRARLAETRAIFRLHYTPTYVSRLNQVGHWFALVTREAIRRGSFTSVPDLIAHTERCVARHNQHPVLLLAPPPLNPSWQRYESTSAFTSRRQLSGRNI